jgi:hypothetical protein
VCQALAKKIGWFPVSTAKILTGMHKAGSIQEIVEKQGRTALGELPEVLLGVWSGCRVLGFYSAKPRVLLRKEPAISIAMTAG